MENSNWKYKPFYLQPAIVPSSLNVLGKFFQNKYVWYFWLWTVAYFAVIGYYMYSIFMNITVPMLIKVIFYFILLSSSLLLIRKVNNQHTTFRMLVITFNYLFRMKKYYRIERDQNKVNKAKRSIKVIKL